MRSRELAQSGPRNLQRRSSVDVDRFCDKLIPWQTKRCRPEPKNFTRPFLPHSDASPRPFARGASSAASWRSIGLKTLFNALHYALHALHPNSHELTVHSQTSHATLNATHLRVLRPQSPQQDVQAQHKNRRRLQHHQHAPTIHATPRLTFSCPSRHALARSNLPEPQRGGHPACSLAGPSYPSGAVSQLATFATASAKDWHCSRGCHLAGRAAKVQGAEPGASLSCLRTQRRKGEGKAPNQTEETAARAEDSREPEQGGQGS